MPMASHKFAAGPKGACTRMPLPDETPKIEGTVDKERRKSQDDTSSRRAGNSGRIVNLGQTPAATVERPPMYGGKKR
jgi:hypothetical protein